MRARTVNFERGQDPKTSMRIGGWNLLKPGAILKLVSPFDEIGLPIGSIIKLDKTWDEEDRKGLSWSRLNNKMNYWQGSGNFTGITSLSPEDFYNSFEILKLSESIDFERNVDPYKSLDLGVIRQNRDSSTRQKNFEAAFPEIKLTSRGEESIISNVGHPFWQTFDFTLYNADSTESLEEREKKYLNWFQKYTDFDIIKSKSNDRTWHPMGDEKYGTKYEQYFRFRMRNKEDIK